MVVRFEVEVASAHRVFDSHLHFLDGVSVGGGHGLDFAARFSGTRIWCSVMILFSKAISIRSLPETWSPTVSTSQNRIASRKPNPRVQTVLLDVADGSRKPYLPIRVGMLFP